MTTPFGKRFDNRLSGELGEVMVCALSGNQILCRGPNGERFAANTNAADGLLTGAQPTCDVRRYVPKAA